MTRITSVVTLCVLAVVGVASAAPNDSAGKRAQLRVLDTRPLVVRGVGFKPAERVRMLVTTGKQSQSKTKLASRAGVVGFNFGAAFQGCGSFSVKAVGSKGTRVSILSGVSGIQLAFPRRPQLDCVPPGVVER